MFSPLIFVVWVAGLVKLLQRPEWRRARLPALVLPGGDAGLPR